MDPLSAVALVVLGLLALTLGVQWLRTRGTLARERARLESEVQELQARLAPITDLTLEAERLRAERDSLAGEISAARSALVAELRQTRQAFETKFAWNVAELERLTKEVEVFSNEAELQANGLYRPYYDLATSDDYKANIDHIYERQARMITDKTAATCPTEWTVEGSKAKGRQMVERHLKLQLRAFNGECDAAVARVRYNNAVALEERIRKSFAAINKLGETNQCEIVKGYLELRLAELRLVHELAEKLQAEKEEQRLIREQMREEEIARKEIEKAQKDAEKEEDRFEVALERARAELAKARDDQDAAVRSKIEELERKLAEAHANKERAISRAQMTRSGHVYVISNEGSFGRDVYKVGMTRRLEPMDRVKELGDASVPFAFDVHAIIYSEDAPDLEAKLHRQLGEHRVNLVNERKEFFAVPLQQIARVVEESHGKVELTALAEAAEWRRTEAMRAARRDAQPEGSSAAAPAVSVVEEARDKLERMRSRWEKDPVA